MSKKSFLRIKKRATSFLMIALMVFSLLPVNTVFAAETVEVKLSRGEIALAEARSLGPSETGNSDSLEYSLDGNPDTYTNSNYNGDGVLNGVELAHPQTYTFTLSETMDISKVGVQPRSAGHLTQLDHFSVYLSMDGSDWTPVKENVNVSSADMTYTSFTATRAKYVKLELYAQEGVDCVSTSEVEIYRSEVKEPVVVEPTAKLTVGDKSYDLPKTELGSSPTAVMANSDDEVKFIVTGDNFTKFNYIDASKETVRPLFTSGSDEIECVLESVESGYYTFYVTSEDSEGEEHTTAYDVKLTVEEVKEGPSVVTDINQEGTTVTLTLDRVIEKSNMSGLGDSKWVYDGDKSLTCTEVPETGEFYKKVVTLDTDGKTTNHVIYRDADGEWKVIADYRYNDGTIAKPTVSLTTNGQEYYHDGNGVADITIEVATGTPVVVVEGKLISQISVQLTGQGESAKYYTYDMPGVETRIEIPLVSLKTGEPKAGTYSMYVKSDAMQAQTVVDWDIKSVVEAPSVDKTDLEAAIEEVASLEQGNYTDSSWVVFEAALKDAKKVLTDDSASQEQVDTALANLNSAYSGLYDPTTDPDKAVLSARIDEVNATIIAAERVPGLYEGDLDVLKAELAKAMEVFDDPNADAETITKAANDLETALAVFVSGEQEDVDKVKLKELLDEADPLTDNYGIKYIDTYWAYFVAAREEGHNVYDDKTATQEEVDAIVAKLEKAFGLLEVEASESHFTKVEGTSNEVTITLDVPIDEVRNSTRNPNHVTQKDGVEWTYNADVDNETYTITTDDLPDGEIYARIFTVDSDSAYTGHIIYRNPDGEWTIVHEYRDEDYWSSNGGDEKYVPTVTVTVNGNEYKWKYDSESPIVINEKFDGTMVAVVEGLDLDFASVNVTGAEGKYYEAWSDEDGDNPIDGNHTRIEIPLIGSDDGKTVSGTYNITATSQIGDKRAVVSFDVTVAPAVDKTKLQALYDKVKDYQSDDEYFKYFTQQLTNSKKTLDDPDATQEVVDRQYNWLNARYYALLVSELNTKYDPENIDLTKYTTESLIPVINMWGITHGKTVPAYQENEASGNVGQMKGWYEEYLEAEKGLVSADDTTEWIGIFGEAATSQETYQGHFEVVETEAVNVDGEDKLQLTVRFINDGLHPIYGKELDSKVFKKFTSLRNCSVRVEAYDANMVSKMSSGLQNVTETEDGVEGTYIVDEGYEYLTFRITASGKDDPSISAGYYHIPEMPSADKTKLQALYDKVKDYTSDNSFFKYFSEELEDAKGVLDDPKASQEEVDKQVIDLNARYYGLLVSELNSKYSPTNGTVDLKLYTTESLVPVINMWGITHNRTNGNYGENEIQDNIGQMQGWYEEYLEAEKGLVLADEDTEWVGIAPDATRTGDRQGHFEVVDRKTLDDGSYQLTIRFVNDGLHPIYGEELPNANGSTEFDKFSGLKGASVKVHAYDDSFIQTTYKSLENLTVVEDGVEGTYIVKDTDKYLSFDLTSNRDDAYSAGYYQIPEQPVPFVTVVDVLEDEGSHVRLEINGPLKLSSSNCITTPQESTMRDLNGFKYEFYNGKHTIVTDSYREQDFDRVALISAESKTTVNCLYYDENGNLQFYSYQRGDGMEEGIAPTFTVTGKKGASNVNVDVTDRGILVPDVYEEVIRVDGNPNQTVLTITGVDLCTNNTGGATAVDKLELVKRDENGKEEYRIEGTISRDHKTITFVIENEDTGAAESGVYYTEPAILSGTYFFSKNVGPHFRTCFELNVSKLSNTIYYNANGGEGGPSSNYTNGTNITIQSNTPTRDGYKFMGWNTAADGSGTTYQPGQSYPIDPNGIGGQKVTLYAMWTETFTVTYTDPYGSFEDQVYEVAAGDSVPGFSGEPSREGWAFSTWNSKYKNGEETSETVTKDRTFSARWTKLPDDLTETDAVNHGAVRVTDELRPYGAFDLASADAPHLIEGTFVVNETTYDAENHNLLATVTITDPEAYAELLNDVYDNYYSDGGRYAFNSTDTPSENLTIHFISRGIYSGSSDRGNLQLKFGTWTLDSAYYPGASRAQLLYNRQFDITLNNDGVETTITANEVSTNNYSLENLTVPTREYYVFKGWNTSADGTGTTYSAADTIEIVPSTEVKDITLYAVWELDIVDTITLSPEDITAYTGGESLNETSFPNLRYRFTLDGSIDLSDGITLYHGSSAGIEVDLDIPTAYRYSPFVSLFATRANSDVTTDPVLIPELEPEYTYDLDESNSDYEGEVNPSDDDQYAGVYRSGVVNDEQLYAEIDGKLYDVDVEEGSVMVRYVSDPEAILDSNEEFMRSVVNDEPTSEVNEALAVVDPNTTYLTNNDPNMTVINRDAVRLFVDELLPPEQSDGVDRRTEMVTKADEYLKAEGMDMNDRNYVFKYLDLVNTVDGNAWVSSTLGTDIYLPYPENTGMDTEFTVLHFRDLHREYGLSTNEEISDAIKNSTIEEMTIEKTPYGIKFHVDQSGFSPFLLTWNAADAPVFDMSNVDTTLDLNEKFDPMTGVKVTDDYGKDLSDRVDVLSKVDTSKVGTYEVTYKVSDDYGNTVETTLVFEVVDKSALSDLVDDASKLNEDQYTTQTYDKLKDALEDAKKVLNDDKATQAEIDAAYDALSKAVSSLDKVVSSIPETGIGSNIVYLPIILTVLLAIVLYGKKRLSR